MSVADIQPRHVGGELRSGRRWRQIRHSAKTAETYGQPCRKLYQHNQEGFTSRFLILVAKRPMSN